MNRLNLCIDIDGTLTDPYYWLPRANRFFGKNVKDSDVTSYRMHEVLGIAEKEYDDFYNFFGPLLHKEAPVRSGVCDVIGELFKEHYIHIVTAREEKMKYVSLDWLKKHKIPFDTMSLLGTPDKVQKAGDLDSDLFIEDSYDNALQLAGAGFEVLLIDCNYNRGPVPPNVTRVNDWDQIRNMIRRFAQQKQEVS